jgi:hypothetical protein
LLIVWVEDDRRRAVEVETPYDTLSVARVLQADLGVRVRVGGHLVPGEPSVEDRRHFDRWQAGEPPWEGRA